MKLQRKVEPKRILGIISVLLLLCILVSGRRSTFSKYLTTSDNLEDIKVQREESEEPLITSLNFNGNTLFFDPSTQTFYYSLIAGDPGAFDPPIEFDANGFSVKLAVGPTAINSEIISSNTSLTIIAYNEEYFSQYSLICTTLPLMNITCSEEISEAQSYMHMHLFDNQSTSVIHNTYSDGSIHVRGGTTRRFPKKGYRISLTQNQNDDTPNKCNLLNLRNDDDWLLYAAYNDQEKIRNVFSSNLWKYSCALDNSLGINNGMEYKYIELFMNNEYYGLYALGYPIDEKQFEIKKESNTDFLYKKIDWQIEENLDPNSTEPVEGYKCKSTSSNTWLPLRSYFATINSDSIENNAILYDSIDIDNAIDIFLFFDLIQGADNITPTSNKNLYIVAKKQLNSYKILFTPWDMDISWGTDFEDTETIPYAFEPSESRFMGNGGIVPLIERDDPDIWGLIRKKYKSLRSGAWSDDAMNLLIDRFEDDIFNSGAYARDMERWPDGIYANPNEKLSNFRNYVMERLYYMDIYYRENEQ